MRTLLFLSLLAGLASCHTPRENTTEPLTIQYQSPYRQFTLGQTAFARLDKSHPTGTLPTVKNWQEGFTLQFSVLLENRDEEKVLLEIPDLLRVVQRKHDPEDRRVQNYSSCPMPDGSVPVMEALLWLEDENGERRPLTVGLPLSLLDRPYGKHNVSLQFTGVEWSLCVDGRLYDNDFAIGYPRQGSDLTWRTDSSAIDNAALFVPALPMAQAPWPEEKPTEFNIQFWTPPYHNAWVGDVATLFHDGRYHLFYLFDRRGHGSKFGKGGHYFEHLSTTDFKHWTEHEAATPIEHQWESFGTGTPFVHDGKLCLSYGLHTTRIYPREKTTLPLQYDYLERHGHTGSFSYDTLSPLYPAGSTYAVSEDGISHFRKTHLLIHPCENPSIYTTADGSLRMLANYGSRGTWASDSVSGGWHCIDRDFPPGGDCTFSFRWEDHDYIIGGFSRLWYKPVEAADSAYTDMVKSGIDFYNGMSVPSIARIDDNRFLMAGWVKTEPWGGPLAIHELVRHPDGRLGNKWMPELVPATEEPKSPSLTLPRREGTENTEDIKDKKEIKDKAEIKDSEKNSTDSFISSPSGGVEGALALGVEGALALVSIPCQPLILTFDVHPMQPEGRLSVRFSQGDSLQSACEWQLQIGRERAQFAPATATGFAPDQKTLREGGDASTAQNYAIENGLTFSRPFTVRILVQPSAKVHGTLMDVEIGGQRTMLSYRPGLFADRLLFRTDKVEIKNVRYALLKEWHAD